MPAFHGPLANYLTTMEDITLSYLEKWESMGSFTWFGELKQLTFEIASTLLMGQNSLCERQIHQHYYLTSAQTDKRRSE